jgi:hypothetical protein
VDRQTLMVRRSIAAGAAVLVLILLVLGVRGCLDARKERAIKDYVQDVSAIVQESDQQGGQLFRLLSGPGGREEAVDVENSLNGLRVQSAQLVDRARDLDSPDEVEQAQRYLLETLEFRRDGLARIADSLPVALGDQRRREGTDQVTAEMQNFLASDVIYSQRFFPSLQGVLEEEDLRGEVSVPRSQFLPDIQWLDPRFVADRVGRIRTGRGGREAAAPGLHGNGLGTVSLGGQALTPGTAATVQLSGDVSFDVQVTNQGDNAETDVNIRITVGRGDDAVELEETLDTIAPGETKTVNVPLAEQPPTGQNVPVEVEVEAVPGEEKTDNNTERFSAIFTR